MVQPTQRNDMYHTPVMVQEVLSWLEQPIMDSPNGWILDCTYGGGGHSKALLDRYQSLRVVGVDRDPDAVRGAVDEERLVVVEANFSEIDDILNRAGLPDRVEGILCDLGVSSHQLDTDDRGFSYHRDGPLDMRMGPDAQRSAADLINEADEGELATVFRRYGEERYARSIAEAIVRERPFTGTAELSLCVAEAVPAYVRRGSHPARKVFQALRIAVNDELASLTTLMETVIDKLVIGGRLVVLSYHSLEDRIVKRAFKERAIACVCPPDLPICSCESAPDFKILTSKAQRPTEEEIRRNPRARSAVLRCGERVL